MEQGRVRKGRMNLCPLHIFILSRMTLAKVSFSEFLREMIIWIILTLLEKILNLTLSRMTLLKVYE